MLSVDMSGSRFGNKNFTVFLLLFFIKTHLLHHKGIHFNIILVEDLPPKLIVQILLRRMTNQRSIQLPKLLTSLFP
jgi:hypothetical protein